MGDMEFRIKMLPTPEALVGGKPGGNIDKNTLAAQQGVLASMGDFLFDLKYVVTQFDMTIMTSAGERSASSKSATFSADQKNLLNGLTKGQRVFFSNIKASGPDGIKGLKDIFFTIN